MNTYERIARLIVETLGVNHDEVSPGALLGDISTDNLDWLALLCDIEISLGIDIDETELDDQRTVGDLVGLVDAKLIAAGKQDAA